MIEPLSPLERYKFDVQGFLRIDGVLSPAEVADMRATIDGQRLPPAGDSIQSQRFGGEGAMLGWDQAFRDLIDHPAALRVLKDLIGEYVRLDHCYGITMRAATSGLGLHGPAQPFDAAQFYAHRMGAMRNGLVTLSWALSDGQPGDGGFGCIPGSHKANYPFAAGAEELVVEVPQPAGSLFVFTEALMHCTIPWQGAGTRWLVMYKYSPGNSSWHPEPAASNRDLRKMTERQRRFILPPSVGGRPATITD